MRPDAAKDWQAGNFTEKLASKDAPQGVYFHYGEAVRAQRKELRETKKAEVIPVPLVVEPEPPKVEEISSIYSH